MEKTSENEDEPVSNIGNEGAEVAQRSENSDEAATKETMPVSFSPSAWFAEKGWSNNPFTFSILPSLFVGYREQVARAMLFLGEKHKFVLVTGPTGSGKTTLLKRIQADLAGKFDTLYVGKPPEKPDDFVDIFNEKFRAPWPLRWFTPGIRNVYQIPDFLNKKLKKKHLVVLLDEIHEADKDILEWIRVLSDQVDNISFLLSGLPHFDEELSAKLETFRKRITANVQLLSLTKEETEELITRRIQHVGGQGNEFSQDVVNFIHSRSGGFPREVLRLCDEFIYHAIVKGRKDISMDLLEGVKEEKIEPQMSLGIIEKMTPMQREILEVLAQKPLSPGQIANSLNLEKYKSRQHAVRSVNNVLKLLLKEGYVERAQSEKTFVYSLTPKIKTLMVKA
ncbi:MAG: AAA family ATPase [Candidatus Aenigmarchaeota archaeon]|nr:AAA family ATPase [Candidatus Aenigmarchaeota archaeon]